ncbi:ESPR-type extended signal peptide-containing protein [Acinetobacter sp. IK40]|uniref:ESPR-type extended signal peptide-containing protein n=1 Tax=Acinetobacter sp. IK40 TaxID=2928897 RepID=UPI002D1F0D33|nr:ESPR-type extended signal peptide-containing protein [Acinetobacter sp. IK40]MEB3793356.1 YadA-like family protein [Acinetobacter sp. IK40]
MNKIYRLVWNKSLNLWTVVSENARGVTKKRNVTTNTAVTTTTNSTNNYQKYQNYQPLPTILALTLSSIFFSGGAFAAANTGGGTSNNDTSMAMSPTAAQCGNGVGQASVSGAGGVAIGCGTTISGTDTTWSQTLNNRRGTGSNNYPTGATGVTGASTAVGKSNRVTGGGGATVVGNANVSDANGMFHNVAVGQGNRTGGTGYNTALGIGNDISDSAAVGNVAIGVNNRTRGDTSIAIGRGSWADANFSIAQGNTATVAQGATGGIALGLSATTRGQRGIAIGSSTGSQQYDAATAPNADGTDSVAIGTGAKGTGNQTTAVGRQARATGNNSSAYGNQANANGVSSVAMGDQSQAQGDNDIAIGRNAATASGSSNNIAMGNGVTTGATGQNVAMGSDGTTANSRTANGGAVSIGRGQRASGDGAVAIGDPNVSNGDGAVTLGRNNTAAGDEAGNTAANGAVAIGNENKAIGQGAVALGNTSTAAEAGSIALGDSANAQAARGVALGSNAVATNADDVALGAGSQTSTATGEGFLTGTAAPTSVVSVGTAGNERRIQHLSDGSEDTDAVNVRQLKAVKDIVDEQGETTASGLGGGSTYDPDTGTVSNPTYNVNGTEVNNVGAAITELDKGWTLQSNGANDGAVRAGDVVDIGTADGEENLQVTKEGNDIKYSLNRDLKVDSVTAGDTVINNDGMTISGGPSVTKSGIDAAGNTISNVGPGVAGTDAVNKDQLDTAAAASKTEVTQGKNISVTKTTGDDGQDIYNVATADDVEFNTVKVGDVNIDGATGKISGVAAGDVNPDSTDAINGSQLANNAQSVADALGGGSTVNPDGTVTNPSYNINGTDTNNVGDALAELDKGWTLQSNGANDGAVKAGDVVDIGTADGEENLQVTKEGNDIKYSLNRDLKVDSVTAGDTVINNDGMTITGGPSVTKSGIDAAGNTISNVGPGVAGTDAVNKDQLDTAAAASKTEVTQGKNISVTKTTGDDGQDIYNVATADDVEFNTVKVGDVNIDGATGKISGVAAGDVNPDSTDAINGSQLANNAQSVADALGGGSTVNPDGTVTNPSYNINGTDTNNVGDALAELDKGWTLQSNGANDGAVRAGDVVDIGTADGEENLQVTKEGNDIKYSLNRDLKVDSVTAGDTVINNDGMTITGGPSVTKSGIDAAGNTISNVGPGVAGTDAVNKDQLDTAAAASKTEVEAGKNMTVESATGDDGQTIYTVATADDVEFNTVKVGDVNIDGATGKISGVSDGTVAAGSTEAVNGGQLHGVADSVKNSIGGETVLNPDGSISTSNVGNTGENNIHDAINSVRGAAVAAKTTVTEGDNIVVTESKNADGSTNYEVATARDVDFDTVKVGDVNIDGTTGKISGVAAGDVNPDSTDAINGSQLANNAQSVADALGGGSTVNPDGTVTNPSYNINGTDTNNVGDALAELDKGWTLQSNGANDGAVRAGDVVDIGTADGEENLQVTKEGNDIKYSLNRDLKVDSVTAGDTVINNDGMTITGGPSVTKSGIDAAGNTISNVGPGVAGTDAVNKDQLDTAAAASKTEVEAGKNMTVESATGDDGQTIYTVATADDVEFNTVKVGDVNIDGTTGKISGVSDGTVAAGSTEAVNGGQLHGVADSVKNSIGGETVLNPDGSITTSNVGNTGENNIHDAIDSVRGAAVAAKTTVTEGDNIVVTESKNADGSTNYEVATARDVDFDTVKVGDVNIDGATGKISGVAAGDVNPDSTDAINGSQLANNAQSVADALGGGSTVNPDGTVTAPNYTVNGTDLTNVGDAITELDKGWTLQSNGANAGAVKAGDTVDIGTADGEENLQVSKEGNDIKYSLNRDLNVDSVTAGNTRLDNTGVEVKDPVGNSTSIVAGGTIVKDAQGNTNANTAAGTTIKNAQGDTTLINTTGMAFTDAEGNRVGPSVSRTGVDAGGLKVTNVAEGEVAAGSKDAVNGGQLNDTADSVGDILGGGVTNEGGKLNGPFTVNDKGYDTVADAIKAETAASKTEVEAGKNMTVDSKTGDDGQTIYTVATADDVEFNTVKVGDVNIDGATGKISGVSDGTVAAGSTEAVNGGQLHGVADSVKNSIGGETVLNPDGSISTSNVGNTGENNIHDAINSVRGAAVAAKTTVTEGDNIVVTESKNADGSTNYEVATARDVDFDTVKVGDVNIDGATGKISGVAAGDVNPDSTDAINGSQLANNAQSVADALGGGSTVNPDGTVTAPNYTVNGTDLSNVGDAITELDKGWTLQSNGANAGAVKAGDTVDIGTADGEENLQVTKEGNDIKYSLNRDLKVDSVTAGDTVINNDGMTITDGPSVTKSGIDAGGKKLTNVAPGTVSADSTDAINGSQLHAQGEGVKNIIGGNTQYDPNTGRYTNPDIGGTGEDNINDAIGAVGAAAKAAKTTVTEGDNMVVTETKNADGSTNYEVATAKDVKFDSVTATDDEGNETVLTATGTQVKDGEGNEAEYGAKGISLKDADGNGTVVNSTGLGFVDPMGNNIGPSITAKGIDAGNTVITGVAPGRVAADSQDAINGSQLKSVSDSVAGAIGGNTTVNPDGTLNTSNIGGTGKDNIHDAIGAVGDAAKAAKSTVTEGKNIVVKESKNVDGSTDYEVSTTPDLEVDSVTAGGTKLDGEGLHIDGGPSVTKDGIDAGDKKVTGVADGTIADGSKDAINGGQLKDVSDSVAGAIGGNTTVNPDGTINTSNIGGTGHNNINDAIGAVGDAAKAAGEAAKAAKSSVSNEDKNITVKESKKADGSTDYEVGLAKDITVDSVTAKDVNANQVNVAGDQGSTTITGGGISIAGPNGEAGPSMTTGGINAGGKKVTGVADGAIHSASKDAINGSQLHQSYQDVGAALGGGAGYDPEKGWTGPTYNVAGGTHNNVGDALGAIDDRVTNLGDQMQQAFYDTNQRIDDVKKRANAGVAAAMALETAPYLAGKYTYAVGAAYHGGENAVGVTLRKTADNGRWSLTGGVAAASQGDPSFRVGVSGSFD